MIPMPSYPLTALVLHKTKLGETDLILTLMAEDGRQVRAVAKGARKPGSRFGARLESYSVVDLLLYTGRSLETITEARLVDAHAACRRDLEHSAGAAVVAELLEKIALEGEGEPILFPLACTALTCIGNVEADAVPLITAAFLLKALSTQGYRPALTTCALCGSPIIDRDSAVFSYAAGGFCCPACASGGIPGGPDPVDPLVLEWVGTLIGKRFSELEAIVIEDPLTPGYELLRFSQEWTRVHLGVTLKSLQFMFSAGIYR